MPPIFNPRLVNEPAGDPGLFIPFFYEKRALLIDAGELAALSARDILKITHLFITHTHMDHFIGFDRILRICLGREKILHAFGPEGFIDRVAAKLNAYSWNLVHNYENPLTIVASEIRQHQVVTCRFDCRKQFFPQIAEARPFAASLLYHEPAFSVEAQILDHDIDCVGYAVKERFSVNIRKERLESMGFVPGPWLYAFKQTLYADADPDSIFEIPPEYAPGASKRRSLSLRELADSLAVITRGRKIVYIADAACHEKNQEKIIRLAADADHLFIEAAFLDEDKEIARRKKHLTASQAGRIAAAAKAKRFTVFHFSPRYSGEYDRIVNEAQKAAGGAADLSLLPHR